MENKCHILVSSSLYSLFKLLRSHLLPFCCACSTSDQVPLGNTNPAHAVATATLATLRSQKLVFSDPSGILAVENVQAVELYFLARTAKVPVLLASQ